jgi:hypothetical protein
MHPTAGNITGCTFKNAHVHLIVLRVKDNMSGHGFSFDVVSPPASPSTRYVPENGFNASPLAPPPPESAEMPPLMLPPAGLHAGGLSNLSQSAAA